MNCSPSVSSVHGILLADTGVVCHSLLQGLFLTQGLNSGLLHCRWILYQLSYERSPGIDQFIVENKLKPYELSLQMQMS